MKTVIISSNCSGGGKTTATLGLMKALKNRGYDIQGFKVGPDYIDTSFHTEITGKASRNLDIYLMGKDGVKSSFSRGTGDLAVIEGVMGLYDGKGENEECSTYAVSKLLDNAPIVLVMTPRAQSLTICAEINGLRDFRNANIQGIILNCISEGYYKLLKKLIEDNCAVKVLGFIPKDNRLELKSRHLGLVQSVEVDNLKDKIQYCSELIEEHVELDYLINICKDITGFKDNFHMKMGNKRIGIAYDEAFRFYYKENLELLEEVGEVIYFSPLKDKVLPKELDFIYFGGGYPEIFKEELSGNKSMITSIRKELESGTRCYAECGGLMYLTENIDGVEMVGFFEGRSFMTNRLNRFGYATLNVEEIKINCHEFHKSDVDINEKTVYKIKKETIGEEKRWKCGYKKKNTLAGYPHVHFMGNMEFLKYILKMR